MNHHEREARLMSWSSSLPPGPRRAYLSAARRYSHTTGAASVKPRVSYQRAACDQTRQAAHKEELRAIRNNLRALEALDAADARLAMATGNAHAAYETVLRNAGGENVTAEIAAGTRERAARAAAFAAVRCGLKTPDVVFFRPTSKRGEQFYGFMHDGIRDAVFVSTLALRDEYQLERTVFHEVRHLAQHEDMTIEARESDAADFAERTLCEWRGTA